MVRHNSQTIIINMHINYNYKVIVIKCNLNVMRVVRHQYNAYILYFYIICPNSIEISVFQYSSLNITVLVHLSYIDCHSLQQHILIQNIQFTKHIIYLIIKVVQRLSGCNNFWTCISNSSVTLFTYLNNIIYSFRVGLVLFSMEIN